MRRNSQLASGLVVLALLVASAARAADAFDAGRVRWTALEYTASKLLLSADARVELRTLPVAAISRQLMVTPSGRPVDPEGTVIEIVYRASGLGRESVTTLWANPGSGATLQQLQDDLEGRRRQRTYRFTDAGAYHFTRRPVDRREEALPPARWTDLSEGMRAYKSSTAGQPVTTPNVLLWMASAADLSRTGDKLQVLAFSRRHLHRVSMEVTGRRTVQLDFTEQQAAAPAHERRGKVEAIVMTLRGHVLDAPPGEEDEFELLGLRGDLELLLDPATRLPLQLRGRAKVLGQITIRLRKATMR